MCRAYGGRDEIGTRVSIWLSDTWLHPEHQELITQNLHLPLGLSQLLVYNVGVARLWTGAIRGRRLCHSVGVNGRRGARLSFAPLPDGGLVIHRGQVARRCAWLGGWDVARRLPVRLAGCRLEEPAGNPLGEHVDRRPQRTTRGEHAGASGMQRWLRLRRPCQLGLGLLGLMSRLRRFGDLQRRGRQFWHTCLSGADFGPPLCGRA